MINSLSSVIGAMLTSLLLCATAMAEPFTPASSDAVIATWPAQDQIDISNVALNTQESAINISVDLLARAAQPGQSYLHGLAQTAIKPWVKTDSSNALLWVTWARIKQHKHDFTGAKKALEKALELQPKNINAHLIMARTHVIQQNYDQAKQSCGKLVTSGDFLSASVCNLEVASYQGKLEPSYSSLKKLVLGLPEGHSKKVWVGAILADMAVRQGLWQESEAWLDTYYNENDISTLIEWADVKLKLKKYQEVDTKLAAIVQRTPSSEDALLVRLALAEKHLNNDSEQVWKQRIKERVALREQRQDLYHASDMAMFYLDIEPNSEKALSWAQINWQQAREYKDQALLERAQEAYRNNAGEIKDQSSNDQG